MLLFLPDIFLIIFHTVLVFVLVFIFDVKFFQVSRFDSLIVLCALASHFFKESKILFSWVCLECGTARFTFFALIIVPRFIEFKLSG